MLKTVSRDLTLTQRAQQQLENLIVERSLQPGDRLPSENEMSRMLGVSRTVVRETVQLLVARGLVESRTGSGIYVKELDAGMIREPMALLLRSRVLSAEDITEVRETLEVKVAGLAAERARPEDLKAMEEAIRALSRPKLSDMDMARADAAFHDKLAVAAANPLFSILSHSLNELMLELHLRTFRLDRAGSTQDTIHHHTRILEFVKMKDAEGARQAMHDHLISSREWTRRVLESTDSGRHVTPDAIS